ncbi:hypothetical protein [Kriegella aquimaris]|uniref:Fibronectin type-III domain-containing protein n=1 Tax=Kriegella aquimaris TaxID=192904 RepID=A0A1G9KLS5_9FLAO|nr:hypothetical protein [Kriegella aquimaris]SDL50556.1 hypothetical protein SAMN04488514_1011043 [Kriegella aquimaris]
MKKVKHSYWILCLFLFVQCGPKADFDENLLEDIIDEPQVSQLIFPENNTECNQGTVLNENESNVLFKWQRTEETDFYTLHLKDLAKNSKQTFEVDTIEIEITLNRGTPYEWYVTSESYISPITATSEKWRFFNASSGTSNYAPFPAEAVTPKMGETVSLRQGNVLDIEWTTTDIDGDNLTYVLFYGKENPPKSNKNETDKNKTAIYLPDGIYYWYIKSIDQYGNASESDIFQFKVD